MFSVAQKTDPIQVPNSAPAVFSAPSGNFATDPAWCEKTRLFEAFPHHTVQFAKTGLGQT
jgi:hypothetical protein